MEYCPGNRRKSKTEKGNFGTSWKGIPKIVYDIRDSMIIYGIRLSPNDYVLVLCFGMPFQEVPKLLFSVFDFLRLPGQYSIMIE